MDAGVPSWLDRGRGGRDAGGVQQGERPLRAPLAFVQVHGWCRAGRRRSPAPRAEGIEQAGICRQLGGQTIAHPQTLHAQLALAGLPTSSFHALRTLRELAPPRTIEGRQGLLGNTTRRLSSANWSKKLLGAGFDSRCNPPSIRPSPSMAARRCGAVDHSLIALGAGEIEAAIRKARWLELARAPPGAARRHTSSSTRSTTINPPWPC